MSCFRFDVRTGSRVYFWRKNSGYLNSYSFLGQMLHAGLVAMQPKRRLFSITIEKSPYFFRFGSKKVRDSFVTVFGDRQSPEEGGKISGSTLKITGKISG